MQLQGIVLLACMLGPVPVQGPLQELLQMLSLVPELQMEWLSVLTAAVEWLLEVAKHLEGAIGLVLEWPLLQLWLLYLHPAPQEVQALKRKLALIPELEVNLGLCLCGLQALQPSWVKVDMVF